MPNRWFVYKKKVTTTYDIISDMATSGSDLDSTAKTGLP